MSRGAKSMASPGVAITFDDGPHPEITPPILDILSRAGAVATFFVVGERVAAEPDLVRRIVASGHALGNHTQTHKNLLLCSPWRARREIEACQQSVRRAVGGAPRVFRAPWGKLTGAARRACADLGLAAYDWTVAPEGWPRPLPVEEIVEAALAAAGPGTIVDLHDVPWHDDAGPRSIAALPAILEGLAARGLVTELLPECRV